MERNKVEIIERYTPPKKMCYRQPEDLSLGLFEVETKDGVNAYKSVLTAGGKHLVMEALEEGSPDEIKFAEVAPAHIHWTLLLAKQYHHFVIKGNLAQGVKEFGEDFQYTLEDEGKSYYDFWKSVFADKDWNDEKFISVVDDIAFHFLFIMKHPNLIV